MNDLIRQHQQTRECPLTMLTLLNIQEALRRKRIKASKFMPKR